MRVSPFFLVLPLAFLSCRGDLSEPEVERPPGYSEASHENGAEPNYDLLFDTTTVHRIDITLDSEVFSDMRDALSISINTDQTPEYVEATITHDDRVWEHVGMRFKALSAAQKAIEDGSEKFSFKLTFDRFETDFPETKNQRFYGFKKLNFSANHKDDSYLREVLATEVFRDGGVVTQRAAFYRVHVDVGEGPVYWGLYTMLEDPDDDPMITEQLGQRGGNLYEAAEGGADWTEFVEAAFEKKNFQEEADFADVKAAIEALHDTSLSAEDWRAGLEERFDVDRFLDFLALNTALVNGDAYGCLAENYYLYGLVEEEGQLVFIPNDFNEAFRGDWVSCGSVSPSATEDTAVDLFHPHIGSEWPLISLLLADETYRAAYEEHLAEALEGAFAIEPFIERVQELHEMIRPHVLGEEGEIPGYSSLSSEAAFDESVDGAEGLIAHVEKRHTLVAEALTGGQ